MLFTGLREQKGYKYNKQSLALRPESVASPDLERDNTKIVDSLHE